MTYETAPQPETLHAAIESLGLSITSEFVPWSQSRKAGGDRSLNWRVTLNHRSGRKILTTDYTAGIGHCPSYKPGKTTVLDAEKIEFETERGRQALGEHSLMPGKAIEPEVVDVVYSLAMDCDVLEYPSFEDWAPNVGCDPDSRSAEKIYYACLKMALALRKGVGEDGLARVREAARDF